MSEAVPYDVKEGFNVLPLRVKEPTYYHVVEPAAL